LKTVRVNNWVIIIPVLVFLIGSIFLFNAFYVSHLQTTLTTYTDVVTQSTTSTDVVTRYATDTVIKTTTATAAAATPPALPIAGTTVNGGLKYLLVGGQNGSWFTASQYPRLYQVSVENHSARALDPVSGMGSVWGGSWNGSEWLISGFGSNSNSDLSPNPFLYLFNGNTSLNDTIEDSAESEWHGGDIFAASPNGSEWFVSGMGSGVLVPSTVPTNHYSAGLFNGTTFIDLTSKLPEQSDGILYANAFNGTEWLVGGGWEYGPGVLFAFDGTRFTDLTSQVMRSVAQFGSVQSISWNGKYWLIGGIGFLAMYNGSKFVDLTSGLDQSINGGLGLDAVNSIAWNGTAWLLGGGLPVAVDEGQSIAWLSSYDAVNFSNLTKLLPDYAVQPRLGSSILSIASSHGSWFIGGYADNQSLLLTYDDGHISDLSGLVSDMNYVNWVGVSP